MTWVATSGRPWEEELPSERCLCVDARVAGNVARFINHHGVANLDGVANLIIQPIFTPGVPGRGFHSSTYHHNLSRFVTETTPKCAQVRPKSGRLCTAVFWPYRFLHWSTSHLNLSRSGH